MEVLGITVKGHECHWDTAIREWLSRWCCWVGRSRGPWVLPWRSGKSVERALFESEFLCGRDELGRSGGTRYYLEGVRVPGRDHDLTVALSVDVWSWIITEVLGIALKGCEYH